MQKQRRTKDYDKTKLRGTQIKENKKNYEEKEEGNVKTKNESHGEFFR